MAPIRLIKNGIDALSSQPKLSIKVSFERKADIQVSVRITYEPEKLQDR